MNTLFKTTLALATFAAGYLAAPQDPQDPKKQDPKPADASAPVDMMKIMQKMQEMASPGKAHKELQRMTGEWKLDMKFRMAEGAPWTPTSGKATGRSVLDGRYVILDIESSMMGMPYNSVQIFGYDNMKKVYTHQIMDSMSTWAIHESGTKNDDGVIDMRGTMVDVVTPNGRPWRSTTTWTSDDSYTVDAYDHIDGKDIVVMTITARKV